MVFRYLVVFVLLFIASDSNSQNRDPFAAEIITNDLDNFWKAYEHAGAEVNAEVLQQEYLGIGSKGLDSFIKGRIENAENLARVIRSHQKYYNSIKPSTDSIASLKDPIRRSFAKLKELYPEAIFPPVYFVIGAMNSGGTASRHGLIIGAEMYARHAATPSDELGKWHREVLKPVRELPEIVAHELIHFQQSYDGGSLLAACVKEGSADFIAELISGKLCNAHVHVFANPIEKELWMEFKERMLKNDYKGWLYSAVKGRPNDLGYWMGYKITKAFYDKAQDKKAAIREILNIGNFETFLEKSGYGKHFEKALSD